MSTSPSISLALRFVVLLPLLLLATITITTKANDLIDQTCKESAESTPNSQGASLNHLGLISITLVKKNVTSTTNSIKNLLGNANVESNMKKGLEDCLNLYSNSISTLDEVARDYRAQRFDDANAKISSVMDSSTTCEDGFQDVGVASPLTKQNKHVFQLCAITLAIISMQSH
ncbi:hypothetical protein Cgig2_015623 [Carnegiea gigantea]|uniref:Pectinesterase inhibitor domain-containing protein n=1 Tax=Carnegiea gigantea TaxID=171969 RepID=A0A9Q1GUQ4_9CARY|nr:hypothetical protein Cgig2_015623 [Carnegiea gigantea]